MATPAIAGMIDDWKSLLHLDDNIDENKSINFFLTASHDPWAELYEHINQLSDPNLGFSTACSFPSRYLFIKKNFEIPGYNLRSCKFLNEFVSTFSSNYASLALTTEYMNAPASAFGHLMLVLHNDPIPDLDSNAIHFSAITNPEDSFLKYSFKGLIGGYSGVYVKDPLFKKIHEYKEVEQRYIIFYQLNPKKIDVSFLIYHLFELRNAQFKYYFLDLNCAHHLARLIGIATKTEFKKKFLYTLPVEIIYNFKDLFVDYNVIPPLGIDLKYSFSQLSDDEKTTFNEYLNKNISDSNITINTKAALYKFYLYSFKHDGRVIQHYDSISKFNFIEPKLTMEKNNLFPDPLARPKPKKLSISYTKGNDTMKKISVGFRPVLIDLHDLQIGSASESELSLLDTKISFSKSKITLEKIKVASLKVMGKYNALVKASTWSSFLGLNRENKNRLLSGEIEIGIGHTRGINELNSISFLLNIGSNLNSKWISAYVAPSIDLYLYISKNFKAGIEGKVKFSTHETYYQFEPFITFDSLSPVTLFIQGGLSNTTTDKRTGEIGAAFHF